VGFFDIMVETLKQAESPQKVIRAFVVSLAPSEEILESLNQRKDFSILRFYLGVKGKNDLTSDFKERRRLTFFGGKIEGVSENLSEAIQREVSEELSIQGLGLPRFTQIGSFGYRIGDESPREVVLTYLPINSLKMERVVIGDNKINEFMVLSLKELRQAIETGMINGLPLEEHLTLAKDSDRVFSISNKEKDKRDEALRRGLSWMEHIENYLKRKINSLINLCTDENGNFDEERFKKEYEKLRSYFMRRGLEVNKKGRNEKKEEEAKKHPLVEVLTSGFLGKEILYYLPELAINGVDWSGLEEAPEGIRIFVDFLKGSLEEFLKGPVNLPNGEQITFSSIEEYKNFLISGKISDVNWVINQFDDFFKGKLKEIFGVSSERIQDVGSKVGNFLKELMQEIRVSGGLYQEYTLINEVQNSSLGRLVNLFLGLDIKENTSYADRLIRFEAGRQLLFIFKALTLIERFYQIRESVQRGYLQLEFERFFDSTEGENLVNIGEGKKIRVRYRRGGIIYDEKPTKNFTSYLRKSFEEREENIVDSYNVNLISISKNNVDDPVRYINTIITTIKNYIEGELGQEIEVSQIKWYGTKNFQQGQQEFVIDGKRQGSQGNRLVRGKVIMKLGSEVLELVIYPYFSLEGNEDGYWGWLEKIKDDKDYGERRLLAGENGKPPFYDLVFPQVLYPRHYEHKLNSAYHNK
jgi:hypothetical protein